MKRLITKIKKTLFLIFEPKSKSSNRETQKATHIIEQIRPCSENLSRLAQKKWREKFSAEK